MGFLFIFHLHALLYDHVLLVPLFAVVGFERCSFLFVQQCCHVIMRAMLHWFGRS
jgi:hypothetical protein